MSSTDDELASGPGQRADDDPADDREAALVEREAALDNREAALAVRHDLEEVILAEAVRRDHRADERDSAADARDMDDTLTAFVRQEDIAAGGGTRRAAAEDRVAAKSDRSASAADRVELTKDPVTRPDT